MSTRSTVSGASLRVVDETPDGIAVYATDGFAHELDVLQWKFGGSQPSMSNTAVDRR